MRLEFSIRRSTEQLLSRVSALSVQSIESAAEMDREALGVPLAAGFWGVAFEGCRLGNEALLTMSETLRFRLVAAEAFCENTLSKFFDGEVPDDDLERGRDLFILACEDAASKLFAPMLAGNDLQKSTWQFVDNRSALTDAYKTLDGGKGVLSLGLLMKLVDRATEALTTGVPT